MYKMVGVLAAALCAALASGVPTQVGAQEFALDIPVIMGAMCVEKTDEITLMNYVDANADTPAQALPQLLKQLHINADACVFVSGDQYDSKYYVSTYRNTIGNLKELDQVILSTGEQYYVSVDSPSINI